jgi:hypothetical protein
VIVVRPTSFRFAFEWGTFPGIAEPFIDSILTRGGASAIPLLGKEIPTV